MDQDELKYWIGLSKVPGIGPKRFARLLQAFASANEAYNASREQFLGVLGNEPSLYSNLVEARAKLDLEAELENMRRAGIRAITILDQDYPDRLKEIHDPPPLLYVQSKAGEALRPKLHRAVAVVGTRTPTPYGRSVAYKIARELGELGVTVVSGLARGIDSTAHRGALESGSPTVAVVGTGLESVYPPENVQLAREIADQGAVISELYMGAPVLQGNFPARNRIISGCCEGVVVVEAGERSGALITANLALDQGREVFAVPGPITSEKSKGCHELIKQGAVLVRSVEDVLAELPSLARDTTAQKAAQGVAATASLENDARRLIDVLRTAHTHPGGTLSVDDMVELSGLPPERVHVCLLELEIKGICHRFPDARYALDESYRR